MWKRVSINKVQTLLAKLCYNPGPIDGAWGRKTAAAAKKFFTDNNFKYDGRLGNDQFSFLTTQAAFSNKKCARNQNKINSSTDNKVTIFEGRSQIPDLDKQVNDATISHYYRVGDKFLSYKNETYKIRPSKSPVQFEKNIEKNDTVDAEPQIQQYLVICIMMMVWLCMTLYLQRTLTVKLTDKSYFHPTRWVRVSPTS